MSRRVLVALLAVGMLAAPVFAQLPVGRVIPTDNFTVGHIGSAVHVAGIVPTSAQVQHISTVVHVTAGISPQFTMFRVNCGTSAATAVSANPNRKSLRLRNSGTRDIFIGGGHATVTTSNGWTIHAVSGTSAAHAASYLELNDFQGLVQCIADGPGQTLEILQILR